MVGYCISHSQPFYFHFPFTTDIKKGIIGKLIWDYTTYKSGLSIKFMKDVRNDT